MGDAQNSICRVLSDPKFASLFSQEDIMDLLENIREAIVEEVDSLKAHLSYIDSTLQQLSLTQEESSEPLANKPVIQEKSPEGDESQKETVTPRKVRGKKRRRQKIVQITNSLAANSGVVKETALRLLSQGPKNWNTLKTGVIDSLRSKNIPARGVGLVLKAVLRGKEFQVGKGRGGVWHLR